MQLPGYVSGCRIDVRVIDQLAETVKARLELIPEADKARVLSEEGNTVAVRAYPKEKTANGDLAKSIAEIAVNEHWKLAELHTEEGRLDEVFRNITLSETAQEDRK